MTDQLTATDPDAAAGSGTDQSEVVRRQVPTRRISFDESMRDVPRHFAGDGDLIMSHVIAMLSASFPVGEDAFVRSVRAYRDQITDPELRRDVAGFIGQEAMHGRQHDALNRRLDELGYPVKRVERMLGRAIKMRERFASPEMNLANTAAVEHFTATFAEIALSDETASALAGDSVVGDLMAWHALEESEHKAVAFDVYKAVGGSERTRVLTMNVVTVMFLTVLTLQTTLSILRDPAARRRGNLRRSLARLRRSPFARKEVWRRLRDYNRPDFHPDDRDTTELVAYWREEFFGADGNMNDRLVSGSAA